MNQTTARRHSARLADLLTREQSTMAEFLVSLAEFDRLRLWEPLGFISLWHYLHRELGLSRAAAFHRKEAARLLQRFREVEVPLRDGRLCLSSVAELAKVLTEGNAAEVLPRFFHRSAREAREVVAELMPRVAVPERVVVTALSSPSGVRTSELPWRGAGGAADGTTPVTPVAGGLGEEGPGSMAPTPHATGPAPDSPRPADGSGAEVERPGHPPRPLPSAGPRAAFEPLNADLRRLHVTVSRRFLEKLELARDALTRSGRGVEVEAVLEAGLDFLLAQQARRRGAVRRPRKPLTAEREASAVDVPERAGERPTSPHVPAEIRRAVWQRDGARCQWPMASGGPCGSTRRLQLDHVIPRARGGPTSVENLRVLCAFHNDLAARQVFGEAWMRQAKADLRPGCAGERGLSGAASGMGMPEASRPAPEPPSPQGAGLLPHLCT